MQNSFVIVADDEEKKSVLWLTIVFLRSCRNTQADRNGTKKVFLRKMECT